MKILFYISILITLFSCSNIEPDKSKDYLTSNNLDIGSGLELPSPWRIEYKEVSKGPLERGKLFYENDIVMSFHLNLRLSDNTLTPDNTIITDTVSSSLKKDTIIFNWFEKDKVQFITVKNIYTYASGPSKDYSLWGELKNHDKRKKELQTLFIKIRDNEIQQMFRTDSLLIRNIIELE